MYNNSLRKRSEWAAAVPKLLKSQVPKYQEKALEGHDFALPLTKQGNYFCLIALSASDMEQKSTGMDRVQRLSYLNGGESNGITFLITENDNFANGMEAYLKLQADLISLNIPMPIIPLYNLDSLLKTLYDFNHAFFINSTDQAKLTIRPGTHVLPYCSANPPLSEHSRNILRDLVPCLRDLADAATTRDGQAAIRESFGGEKGAIVANDVMDFWRVEYVFE